MPIMLSLAGEEGRLLPARVVGWKEHAYLHPKARVPRAVSVRGVVTPFDSSVWDRSRMARLFGMKYSIEMYVPAAKRIYGLLRLPISTRRHAGGPRADLKADRGRKVLMVQSAFLEPQQDARRVVSEMAAELQNWLELDRIEVATRGDLATLLRTTTRDARPRRA